KRGGSTRAGRKSRDNANHPAGADAGRLLDCNYLPARAGVPNVFPRPGEKSPATTYRSLSRVGGAVPSRTRRRGRFARGGFRSGPAGQRPAPGDQLLNSRSIRQAMRTILLIASAILFVTSRPIGIKALAIGLSGLLVMAMVVPQPARAQFGLFGG